MTAPLPMSQEAVRRLRLFRKTRGITAEQLANGLSQNGYFITRSTLTNMENGRVRVISVDLLLAAMKFLQVSFSGFFTGPLCTVCDGKPAVGFTCNMCGAKGLKHTPGGP